MKIIHQEFLTYLAVGGLTAFIYFGFFALNVEVLELSYRVSMSIAYVFAVGFHFFANRKFTFSTVDGQLTHQWLRYLVFLLINYLITLGVMSFFVEQLGFSTYLSAVLSVVVTVGVGYFVSKFWVFRNTQAAQSNLLK